MLSVVMMSVLAASGAKMAVLSFTASGVDATVASSVTESVTAEIAVRGYFDPISAGEIQSLLGAERQKQLLGCGEETCITELAGALGAPYLMSGSLVRIEGVFQLNIQVLESAKSQSMPRWLRCRASNARCSSRWPLPFARRYWSRCSWR